MSRPRAPWLTLLSALPADAVVRRSPVLPDAAVDSPVAGWENLVVDRSDLPHGWRIVMVTLDAAGTPIAASDHVHHRDVDGGQPPVGPVTMHGESVGGRLESDGSFRGTHWTTDGPEPVDDEPPQWRMTPRPPAAEEVAALLALVRDVVARTRPA